MTLFPAGRGAAQTLTQIALLNIERHPGLHDYCECGAHIQLRSKRHKVSVKQAFGAAGHQILD